MAMRSKTKFIQDYLENMAEDFLYLSANEEFFTPTDTVEVSEPDPKEEPVKE